MNIQKLWQGLPSFNKTEKNSKKAEDRDAQQQQQGGDQERKPPNRDEVIKAMDILREVEDVKAACLTLEMLQVGGEFVISVKDESGSVLRRLKRGDIWRLLENGPETDGVAGPKAKRGRILDSRI